MNIIFAVSEAVPFCKTGGLADVAGALPKALARSGMHATVFLPAYRAALSLGIKTTPAETIRVPMGRDVVEGRILQARAGDVDYRLIDCPRFFDRDALYGPAGGEFEDNALRYAFFSRAVLEGAALGGRAPDVFHCHDWQTGLIPAFLKTVYAQHPILGKAVSLYTVHNMAYQGVYAKAAVDAAGLPEGLYAKGAAEFFGKLSYMKAGLVYADRISTVSPAYAEEIQTKEFGCGLEETVISRRDVLAGILNGLDTDLWNPAQDTHIAQSYSAEDVKTGKVSCRSALRKECGFDMKGVMPIMGSVTRLDRQKGLDIALEVLPEFLEKGGQYVLVGMGDPVLEEGFTRLAKRWPDRVHYHDTFDDPFARRVYAGADIFLMPSRFEPCGLGQMIAMRYGTLPLAVRTGGLTDTVAPSGFLADAANAGALRTALQEAVSVFQDSAAWENRVADAMNTEFDWAASAKRYVEIYRSMVDGEGYGASS